MYTAHVRGRMDAFVHKANTRLREPSSWALPKQSSSIAPDYVWANAGIVFELQYRQIQMLRSRQTKTRYHFIYRHG
jgi:hypothetical protein